MKLQKNENNKDNSKERTQLRIREIRKLHPNLIT